MTLNDDSKAGPTSKAMVEGRGDENGFEVSMHEDNGQGQGQGQ